MVMRRATARSGAVRVGTKSVCQETNYTHSLFVLTKKICPIPSIWSYEMTDNGAAPSPAGAAGTRLRLGTAPDSWGVWFADDPRQLPWRQFLDEAAGSGYEWIELGPYGYLPTDLEQL